MAKTTYRGFEIDVHKERSLGCGVLTYFSVFRESDGYEVTSGFSYDMTRVTTQVKWYKGIVDDILDRGDPDGLLESFSSEPAVASEPCACLEKFEWCTHCGETPSDEERYNGPARFSGPPTVDADKAKEPGSASGRLTSSPKNDESLISVVPQ